MEEEQIKSFLFGADPNYKEIEAIYTKVRDDLMKAKCDAKELDCTMFSRRLFGLLNAEKFLMPKFKREEN